MAKAKGNYRSFTLSSNVGMLRNEFIDKWNQVNNEFLVFNNSRLFGSSNTYKPWWDL